MLVTSRSTSRRPRTSWACFLTDAQVAMPVLPSGEFRYVSPAARPPSSLPVETGLPFVSLTYSRRNTWCDGCDVYVWLWSTQGESVFVASWMSSAVPSLPSGPGWFCARVSTMNCWCGSVTSSLVFGLPSGPSVISGSSGLSGTKTALPLLTVWSTPWSKNCPKKVNIELYGGERPTSVVTFGMNSVLCDGTQPTGSPPSPVLGSGSVLHGDSPGLPWDLTGNSAAAMAAGLVDVWSTIRLLIVRGWESTTLVAGRVS